MSSPDASTRSVAATPVAGPSDTSENLRADVELILNQAHDAVGNIESLADEIDEQMIELCSLEGLPEDVEDLANDLSDEVKSVTFFIEDRLAQLRKAMADWPAGTDGGTAANDNSE